MTHTKLIERLREMAVNDDDCSPYNVPGEMLTEAAALIEQQEAVIGALQAERVSLIETKREQIEALSVKVAEFNRLATDRQYLMWAYENMLMKKGLEVAKMWRNKNVKRVHFSWGPDADKLTGEERASLILEWENAPSSVVKNVDTVIGK